MSRLIAIEGIDGSGKGTQAKRLHERLQQAGYRAGLLSFPRYQETLFGRAIGEFLNGRFGSLAEVHPQLASLLYAGDRLESRELLLRLLAENDVLTLDRYVASNIAHQGSKLEGDEQAELIRWIEQVEYGVYQLPRPALTLFLDLPVLQAQELIRRKDPRSYTQKEADLQEADGAYLERVRQVYLRLAAQADWRSISCLDANGELRSVEAIGADLWQAITPLLEN